MNDPYFLRLEYDAVKTSLRSFAVTPAGRRLAERLSPGTDLYRIRRSLEESEEALALLGQGGSVPIPSMDGMERVLDLLGTSARFGVGDFAALSQFLHSCGQLIAYMERKRAQAPAAAALADALQELAELRGEIDACIRHGRIDDHASPELSRIRRRMDVLEERTRSRLGDLLHKHRALLQDAVIGMRGTRYVLSVKKEFRKKVAGAVVDESASGQTIFVEPEEIASLQAELAGLKAEEAAEEDKILYQLSASADRHAPAIAANAEAAADVDFAFAKARYAASYRGASVALNRDGRIRFEQARHPLLGEGCVPLDLRLGEGYRALIVTGPNTGGKTIALKTAGLLTLMAQSGLLLPVAPGSEAAVFDYIAADIGDGQSIAQNLSTFSAHVRTVKDILAHAGPNSLVLLDELAAGTDPGEGIGLSIAVLEELHRRGCTVMATTHFSEIKAFAARAPGFENARMAFDAETLAPLYRLHIGEAGESCALLIARKLGLPDALLRRSEELIARKAPGGGGSPDWRAAAKDGTAGEEVSAADGASADADRGDRHAAQAASPAAEAQGAGHAADTARPEPQQPDARRAWEVGDVVWIPFLKRRGVVFRGPDAFGYLVVQVQKEKMKIHAKRLKPYLRKEQLYPEQYDLSVVFDSKETRKARKRMNKRHVEGLRIETSENWEEKR